MMYIKKMYNCIRLWYNLICFEFVRLENKIWAQRKIKKFKRIHGYYPNTNSPTTFSEKLIIRILFDQDPFYEIYAVKHLAKKYIRSLKIPNLKFANDLKVLVEIQESDFADLPNLFVIKSSFGSGLNKIIYNKSDIDIKSVCNLFNSRVKKIKNGQNRRYLSNVIIFEEFIGTSIQNVPDDYKFHCFNSKNGKFDCLIQIDTDRYSDHRQTIFDADFRPLDMHFYGKVKHEIIPEKPKGLDVMLSIAKRLSVGFDYVRIDLFHTENGIYFGEITPFHQGGLAPILPKDWDRKVGDLWDQKMPYFDPSAR